MQLSAYIGYKTNQNPISHPTFGYFRNTMTANVSITTHKANMLKTIATEDPKCSPFTTIVLATTSTNPFSQ